MIMEKKHIQHVDDEVVIDSQDVERAQELSMRRHGIDSRAEETVRVSSDETLTVHPK